MTAEYRVTWAVDVEADDHLDAIRQAMGMLADPHNTATIFEAQRGYGPTWVVDMEDPDDPFVIFPKEAT